MKINMDYMFYRSPSEEANCREFVAFLNKFSGRVHWKQIPQAPWQVDVKTKSGKVVSFWPHKLRAVDQLNYKSYDFVTWHEADDLLGN